MPSIRYEISTIYDEIGRSRTEGIDVTTLGRSVFSRDWKLGTSQESIVLPTDLAPATKSTAEIVMATNPTDGDTYTIDGKVYTFKTSLTDVDGYVLIGALVADSRTNFEKALELQSGAGTNYALSTTLHPTCEFQAPWSASSGDIDAKQPGARSYAVSASMTATADGWGIGVTAVEGGVKPGYLYLQNRETFVNYGQTGQVDNYISFGFASGDFDIELYAGQIALLPMGDETTLYAKAESADALLELTLIEF